MSVLFWVACSEGSAWPGCKAKDRGAVDVIVVGAGLAGLSAAFELRDMNVVLLEKGNRLGGRVFTKQRHGVTYELGALFAYDPRWMPSAHVPSHFVQAEFPIGVSLSGHVVLGKTVDEVLKNLDTGNKELASHRSTTSEYGENTREAVRRAFFGVIHPGEMHEYIPERQRDWRVTFPFHRFSGGNSELVAALAQEAGAEILLNANALAVRSHLGQVDVDYVVGYKRQSLTARAVVVATPADAAARLLGDVPAKKALAAVRYAQGVVVVVCVRDRGLLSFSYIVTPDSRPSTVFSTPHGNRRVLTVYYAGKKAQTVLELPPEKLFSRTLDDLNQLRIGSLSRADILFSDTRQWRKLGTIVSSRPYGGWKADFVRPRPGVFLAGDYMSWNADKMPYGMTAALRSGKIAGQAVKAFLSDIVK